MAGEGHEIPARRSRAAAKAEKAEKAEQAEQAEQPPAELSYAEMERLRARLTRKYH